MTCFFPFTLHGSMHPERWLGKGIISKKWFDYRLYQYFGQSHFENHSNKNVVLFREINVMMVLSWSSLAYQTLCNKPHMWYIHPYYWVYDPPLLYGNNGSLDSSTHGDGIFNNAPMVAPATGQWVHLHGQSLQISPPARDKFTNFPGQGKTGNFDVCLWNSHAYVVYI